MADTVTTNYGFVKPEPGGSNNNWGPKLNANADQIDAILGNSPTRQYGGDGAGGATDTAAFNASLAASIAAFPKPIIWNKTSIQFGTAIPGPDTVNFWPYWKSFVEGGHANGKTIVFDNNRAWWGGNTSPSGITIPVNSKFRVEWRRPWDMTELPLVSFRQLMTYTGRLATNYVTANFVDLPAGSWYVDCAAGGGLPAIARGQLISLRAIAGLLDINVGAHTLIESKPAASPASPLAFNTGSSYTALVHAVMFEGWTYLCTTNTGPGAFNPAHWTKIGFNGKQENKVVERVEGTRIYFTEPTRFAYPAATRLRIQAYEDADCDIRFVDLQVNGNAEVTKWTNAWVGGGTPYAAGDSVIGNNDGWRATAPHNSGATFSDDLALGLWETVGNDRIIGIDLGRHFSLDGGLVQNMSGGISRIISVDRWEVKDFEVIAPNYRGTPGGVFYYGNACSAALLQNITTRGGSQVLMMSGSGGHYGITAGVKHVACHIYGSYNSYSTHSTHIGPEWIGCTSEGSEGSAWDIRVQDAALIGCRAKNTGASVVVARFNLSGLCISDFKSDKSLSGFVLTNAGTLDYDRPPGNITLRDIELLQVGGSGSHGALDFEYGDEPGVFLGQLNMSDVIVEVNDNVAPITIAGEWINPQLKNVVVKASPGVSPTGRAAWFHSSGAGAGNGPSDIVIEGFSRTSTFADIDISDDTGTRRFSNISTIGATDYVTIASASTITLPAGGDVFYVSGVATVNKIANAARYRGRRVTFYLTGIQQWTHNSAGSADDLRLAGLANFAGTAFDNITLRSNGSLWVEEGRVVI